MKKRRRPRPALRTKAEALARVAQLERQGRRLTRERVAGREQQRATAEILRVMSAAPDDVQPVLDVISRHAVQLCQGYFSAVYLVDDGLIDLRATHNLPSEWREAARPAYP